MNRLTKKEEIKELSTLKKHNVLMTDNDYKELKLGQLEDIEQELGIDLTTLLKALKNGFYAITDKEHNTIGFIKGGELYSRLCFDTKKIYTIGSNENYYFKNYGRTWALTRQELENEKN